MMPVKGSCSAKKVVDFTKKRLKLFNLDLKSDIIGATTDGASIMMKFGRSLDIIDITCLAHGIHLAARTVILTCMLKDYGPFSVSAMFHLWATPKHEVSAEIEPIDIGMGLHDFACFKTIKN